MVTAESAAKNFGLFRNLHAGLIKATVQDFRISKVS